MRFDRRIVRENAGAEVQRHLCGERAVRGEECAADDKNGHFLPAE
jgi:hypothetical protein